jgi:hypothetical protein
MAETENKIEALEQEAVKEVSEANAANPQADAPKKNAVAAEPTHLKNDAEDLGAPVVKPTDSNPADPTDASGDVNTVTDSATFDLRNGVLQSDKSVTLLVQTLS